MLSFFSHIHKCTRTHQHTRTSLALLAHTPRERSVIFTPHPPPLFLFFLCSSFVAANQHNQPDDAIAKQTRKTKRNRTEWLLARVMLTVMFCSKVRFTGTRQCTAHASLHTFNLGDVVQFCSIAVPRTFVSIYRWIGKSVRSETS